MPDHWNRQIERWMNVFSDDDPDLMGLELVREFDILAEKYYSNFEDDLNDWSESSGIYVGIRSAIVREEVDIVLESSYPSVRPTKKKRTERKAESVPVSAKRYIDKTSGSGIKKINQVCSEDVIVSDKNIKIVLQLPIINKKENIMVVANDDYSITISHLNYEGKRRTRNLEIPYEIDFETVKATYKNGILEVIFDR
jgi:hypothetical protein